ncbi:hypothetical protein LINGRAHAP2_LOCUS17863 [Linum grandiflorum]
MFLCWITNTRSSPCSIRSSATDNGRLLFTIFTAKQIVLRIIWLILIIPLYLVFILLILLTGVCPTGFIMTLLACYSLGVLVF